MDEWCGEEFEELGCGNWKTKAQERGGWKRFLKQAKTYKGW
jgi:hypothetical protein